MIIERILPDEEWHMMAGWMGSVILTLFLVILSPATMPDFIRPPELKPKTRSLLHVKLLDESVTTMPLPAPEEPANEEEEEENVTFAASPRSSDAALHAEQKTPEFKPAPSSPGAALPEAFARKADKPAQTSPTVPAPYEGNATEIERRNPSEEDREREERAISARAEAERASAERKERAFRAAAAARANLSGAASTSLDDAVKSGASLPASRTDAYSLSDRSSGASSGTTGGGAATGVEKMEREVAGPGNLGLSGSAGAVKSTAQSGTGGAGAGRIREMIQKKVKALARLGGKFPADFDGRTVKVKVTVGLSGGVADVVFLSDVPEEIAGEVSREIRSWTFPKPETEVTETLKFMVVRT